MVVYRSEPYVKVLPDDAAIVDFGNRFDVLSEEDDMFMMSFALIFESIVPPVRYYFYLTAAKSEYFLL